MMASALDANGDAALIIVILLAHINYKNIFKNNNSGSASFCLCHDLKLSNQLKLKEMSRYTIRMGLEWAWLLYDNRSCFHTALGT